MQRKIWIALGVLVTSVVILGGFTVNKLLTRAEAATEAVNETVTRVEEITDSSHLAQVGKNIGVVAGAAVNAFDSILESR